MAGPTILNEDARHLVFLAAAWIASVDGHEDGTQLDALCQLRDALNIAPTVARRLHHIARNTEGPSALPTARL